MKKSEYGYKDRRNDIDGGLDIDSDREGCHLRKGDDVTDDDDPMIE